MDGNGRWAEKRGLPRTEGHRAGARAAREIVAECRRLGVPYLTLYAFSSENWSRPRAEISALFALLLEFLNKETPELLKRGARLNVIGDLDGLPAPLRAALKKSMERTAAGDSRMILNLALNYGSRAEIARAVRLLLARKVDPADVTEESIAQCLDTGGQPDPDLLIRTSGEQRLSNFLLYQAAYSELYFSPVLWPDFDAAALREALAAYAARERRFGKAGEDAKNGGFDGC